MYQIKKDPVCINMKGIEIPVRKIRKRAGLPSEPDDASKSIEPMFQDILKTAADLIEPRGSYRLLMIQSLTQFNVCFQHCSFRIESPSIAKLIHDCDIAVIFMATIGSELENKIKSYQNDGKMTEAFLLDAAGSEIADAAAEELHRKIVPGLFKNKCRVTPRFSPGYGDWPLTVQSDILHICNGEQIGITLNVSCMMHPRKSVSAIFGIKPNH